MTLNIGCHGSHSISTTTLRVSGECWSGVWIRGCRVGRGLWVTFRGGRGLGVAFWGGIGWGAGVEGAHGSVGDCWKGLEAQRMPKVSKVGVGNTLRCLQSRKEVAPWQSPDPNPIEPWATCPSWTCASDTKIMLEYRTSKPCPQADWCESLGMAMVYHDHSPYIYSETKWQYLIELPIHWGMYHLCTISCMFTNYMHSFVIKQ